MTADDRRGRTWDADVRSALGVRFGSALWSLNHHLDLWSDHLGSGLANAELVVALCGSMETAFRQRVWEMRLARHLRACGHVPEAPPTGTPDFRFRRADGLVVWVEAVSPEPGPALAPDGRVRDPGQGERIPFDAMLLRWTAAMKEKSQKGAGYRAKGVVKSEDAYVVAIDGSQLSTLRHAHGASRKPFVVEAVFAMGPAALAVDEVTGAVGGLHPTSRLATVNANGAPVPTERFFDPSGGVVSAVLGCCPPQMGNEALLEVQVAYNPLAGVPLAPGLFGNAAEEWIAVEARRDADGVDWDVSKILDP